MLTRQFGVLILVGLAISWLLGIRAARVSKRPLRFSAQLATAAVLPLAALAYQLILAQSTPSWAQLYSIARLQTHLLESWPALLVSVAWRLTMIAQYMRTVLESDRARADVQHPPQGWFGMSGIEPGRSQVDRMVAA